MGIRKFRLNSYLSLRLQFSPRHVRFGVYMRITVESLSKRYGGVRALDGVSFTIEPGQILAVLGVNGAGKTTLLRCFSGVVAGSGSILYDGERFTRGSMNLRRKIAFLPGFPNCLSAPYCSASYWDGPAAI